MHSNYVRQYSFVRLCAVSEDDDDDDATDLGPCEIFVEDLTDCKF